jgi:hypothetical protein
VVAANPTEVRMIERRPMVFMADFPSLLSEPPRSDYYG